MSEQLTQAEVKRAAKQGNKAKLEQRFLESWRRLFPSLPKPVMQYRFHPVRLWRFDFAWTDARIQIAVEIDGGSFIKGGHNRPVQQQKDYEKARAAVRLGWRLLKFNTLDLKDPDWCATEVAEFLTNAKEVA